MTSWFKIQKVTTVNTLSKTQSFKTQQNAPKSTLGQVILSIPAIPLLTYSSHALIQILSSFFENQSGLPSYKQVQKALQIVSLPQIDDILKQDIQKLILKNIHKKKDVYAFFCLWAQYLSIQKIIDRLQDRKTQEKVIYTILFVYLSDCSQNIVWYENLAMKEQVNRLIKMDLLVRNSKILEEIDGEIANLKVQNWNQFQNIVTKLLSLIKMSSTLSHQLNKILTNFIKSKENNKFIDKIVEKYLTNEQSTKQNKFQHIVEFLSNNNVKEVKDIFDNAIKARLENKFNSEKKQAFYEFVRKVFADENKEEKLKSRLKQSIKKWISMTDQNILWEFFQNNFGFFRLGSSPLENKQRGLKKVFLLDFLDSISKQSQNVQKGIQKMLFSRYLYHFFQGKSINFALQLLFLDNKQGVKFQSQRQDICKGLKHIRNQKFLNVLTFNKSSFPQSVDWKVDISFQQMQKKYESVSAMRKILSKVKQSLEKIQEQMLKENKRVEILYNVVRVQIDKKAACVTVQQLAEILKSLIDTKSLPFSLDCYRTNYSAVSPPQQSKMSRSVVVAKDQQVHPIIMEAKIIKFMKKQLKPISVIEISAALKLTQQRTQQTVKKLVTKGYLEEHKDEKYSYEA